MLDKKNIIIITLLFILYFLLFPLSISNNLFYTRGNSLELVGKMGVLEENPVSFVYRKSAGYFNHDLKSLYSININDGIVLLSNGYINYSKQDEYIVLKNTNDKELYRIKNTGYPFNINDRLFVIGRDRKKIKEIKNGEVVWERDFNSVITSISGNQDMIIAGFITGEFIVIDSTGYSFFNYEPGGSRVSIVYSVEISEDGKYIGVVSGLDPQRFILYEKRGREYKPIFVNKLKDEYRRSLLLEIPLGNKKVFIESFEGFKIIDIGKEDISFIESDYSIKSVKYIDEFNIYMVHSAARNYNNLKLITWDNRVLMDKDFVSENVTVDYRGDLIYIIIDGSVISLNLKDY